MAATQKYLDPATGEQISLRELSLRRVQRAAERLEARAERAAAPPSRAALQERVRCRKTNCLKRSTPRRRFRSVLTLLWTCILTRCSARFAIRAPARRHVDPRSAKF